MEQINIQQDPQGYIEIPQKESNEDLMDFANMELSTMDFAGIPMTNAF